METEGDGGEHRLEFVLRRRPDLSRVRRGAEKKRLHWSDPCPLRERMPTRKPSMSAVFISMTAFMSGR